MSWESEAEREFWDDSDADDEDDDKLELKVTSRKVRAKTFFQDNNLSQRWLDNKYMKPS